MEALKYGDRIRYIGHTAKCTSCVKAAVKIVDPSGLNDQDEFTSRDDYWIDREGEEGIIFIPGAETSWINLDNFGNCSAYNEHLEVLHKT